MPILKAPAVQPKNSPPPPRLAELKSRLACYAEFIHASASYVVSVALSASRKINGKFA